MAHPFIVNNERVKDSRKAECTLYPDIHDILAWLKASNIQVGIASRVRNIAGATLLLHLFNIRHHFWPVEIYPTSKVLHFRQIRKKTGLEFEEMLFFDDDKRNLKDLTQLKLPCVHVIEGLNSEQFFNAFTKPLRLTD